MPRPSALWPRPITGKEPGSSEYLAGSPASPDEFPDESFGPSPPPGGMTGPEEHPRHSAFADDDLKVV